MPGFWTFGLKLVVGKRSIMETIIYRRARTHPAAPSACNPEASQITSMKPRFVDDGAPTFALLVQRFFSSRTYLLDEAAPARSDHAEL